GGNLVATGSAVWMASMRNPLLEQALRTSFGPHPMAKLKPHGQWNKLELKVKGPWIWASVNGDPTLGSPPRGNPIKNAQEQIAVERGRIGLLALFGTTRYRKIEICELPKSLFNGVDLSDWVVTDKPEHPNPWRAEAGALVASNAQPGAQKDSKAYQWISSKDKYSSYRLTFEFQASHGGLCYLNTVAPSAGMQEECKIPIGDDSFEAFRMSPYTGFFTGVLHPFKMERVA